MKRRFWSVKSAAAGQLTQDSQQGIKHGISGVIEIRFPSQSERQKILPFQTMGNLQFHPMKVHMLSFWAMVLGASSLLGQVVAPDRSQLEPYRTSCFVVNYTPHPIHLAYLDAYDQLSARETDDTIAPGDTLGMVFGSILRHLSIHWIL